MCPGEVYIAGKRLDASVESYKTQVIQRAEKAFNHDEQYVYPTESGREKQMTRDELMEWFKNADPTAKASDGSVTKYFGPIMNWLFKEKTIQIEDQDTIHDTLTFFHKLRDTSQDNMGGETVNFKGKEIKLKSLDLNQIKSPGDLREVLQPFYDMQGMDKWGQVLFFLKNPNNKVQSWKDGDFTMYKITDYKSQGQFVFQTAYDLNLAVWCVKSENFFNHYGAPYYMFLNSNNRPYALASQPSGEFLDHQDRALSMQGIEPIKGLLEKVFDKEDLQGTTKARINRVGNATKTKIRKNLSSKYLSDVKLDPSLVAQEAHNFLKAGGMKHATEHDTNYRFRQLRRYFNIEQKKQPTDDELNEEVVEYLENHARDTVDVIVAITYNKMRAVPKLEDKIAKNPGLAVWYAKHIKKGRWPEAEAGILKDANATWDYIRLVVKGPMQGAENVLKDTKFLNRYHKMFSKAGENK
jgi:hypothetical protein